MAITNYGELKDAVARWINRDDLTAYIPDFISIAEAEIYRTLSVRGLEVSLEVDRTAEDPPTGTIPVPADYREMITFESDGRPLTRVSLTYLQSRQVNTVIGWPSIFARDGDNFSMWPSPDTGRVYDLYYYGKPAPMTSDASTTDLLQEAPDLFLYGSLVEAEPYLRGDQLQLVELWRARYNGIMSALDIERAEEDRSGSNNEVQGGFGASPGTGWARGGHA